MTTREIRAHVEELYGVTVSRELISKVTDEVHEELREWRARPLEPVYPIVYFDALRVKIRDEGVVQNKAVHLAIGVTPLGRKEILGIWTAANEGAKFWLRVMNELQARGVRDVLIAVVDGLKGFPEAIETVFPEVTGRPASCTDPVFAGARFVEDAQGPGVGAAADLPGGDGGGDRGGAGRVRGGSVGSEVPGDRSGWRRNWEQIIPFFAFSTPRRVIYTTNAIESLNSTVRRAVRTRGSRTTERRKS